MDIEVREQIKSLAARRAVSLTNLAAQMAEMTGKKYSIDTISARLRRGTVTYNEVLLICKILHYKIDFIDEL